MSSNDASRAIGKIVSVSADRLVVELHRGSDNFTVVGFDDVHYVATLGSCLIVPTQSEYVVLEVIGLREKDLSTAYETGPEMNKATAAKFLDVVPVGSMPVQEGLFKFGVSTFPPLYADALYARDEDLDRIFNVDQLAEDVTKADAQGEEKRGTVPHVFEIGTSAVFKNYPVKAQLDAFFGGHVAVLGNTGSGKSCTVASILQSVFIRAEEFKAIGASFVILDVNGEYRAAFENMPWHIYASYFKATRTAAEAEGIEEGYLGASLVERFLLPHWFMTVDEWVLLLRASEKTQQPVLKAALGLTTLFCEGSRSKEISETNGSLIDLQNHVLAKIILAILHDDSSIPSKEGRVLAVLQVFSTLEISRQTVKRGLYNDFGKFKDGDKINSAVNYEALLELLNSHVQDEPTLPAYGNVPFSFEYLQSALDLAILYEESNGNKQIREYCSQLVTRLKSVSDNPDFEFLRTPVGDIEQHCRESGYFVDRLLGIEPSGKEYVKERQICIIDLNDASDEIVELVSAVVSRLIFDRLRYAIPRNRMPVHLVLEEAHRYISERSSRFAIDASVIFHRIAKEGRKYGAFLMVASQRPSELSKTVLSQCNNFIVHRIQNPDDLSQIRQMTPFISETVLKRLPSLPKQHALIFGSAVKIPTTFRVRDACPKPNSDDTQIRDLWYIPENPKLDWSL
ncbi:MAG: ATPase [Salinicola sp.]|uniref:ATP-binding protein n=1 Tax=uncultured Salinicola sp. TaxID=1193542 RepID=UPI000C937EB3|nr:DUF87 domain-containing protein [uncultured Salinicola sp.]MAM59657.1 ATPase [Salinicola sp.]